MKILLAADGSPFTRIAAQQLVAHLDWLAKPPEIHLLHVHAPMPYPGATGTGNSAVTDYQREESLAALAVAEKELIAAGIPYVSSWIAGDVVEQLAQHVKHHKIDLVVMGSRGHGALATLALGSVTARCIAALHAPVLVVHNEPPKKAPSRREKVYGAKTKHPAS